MDRAKAFKTFWAIVNANGLKEEVGELCLAYSSGIAGSLSLLEDDELYNLVNALKAEYNKPNFAKDDATDKQRKKLISMAHQLWWRQADGKIDMKRVDNWCIQYGHGHKKLNAYTATELPKLLTQFEIMFEKELTVISNKRK